ncbi:helix-turn-helix domain-containing protein [Brachybacterium squillarum]|uniref:helix-turn-helix domain-containing protein n=1 Tax=Brachybacterium squillarum TaxID=661979 RepID=UPI0002629C68|nr:helix-turn-helix domain-containing protein [Brachybacterium squillarum]
METLTSLPIPDDQVDCLESLADDLPVESKELLHALVACLRNDDDIVAFDPSDTLSPNAAAKRLGMSRTHLYKLLDDGEIPSHRVGRDRRIFMRDLMNFQIARHESRRRLAADFAHRDAVDARAAEELAELL